MNYELRINKNNGQVAIVVLLVSAVMLTLGLTISKKESTDIKIATNEELYKKAFDVAESGIQYYLGTGGSSYTSPGGESMAQITLANIADNTTKIDFGEFIPAGSSESFWLVDHLANGDIGTSYFSGVNVDVCSLNYNGQIKVDYFYKVGTSFNLKRMLPILASNCVRFDTGYPANLPVLLVVTPVTSGGKFYVSAASGGTFSSQGIYITSNGSAGGAQAGVSTQANKTLTTLLRYKMPGFMAAGMVAEGSILSD